MNQILLLFMMFLGGIAIAIQPSINGRLAQKVGVLESSMISFTVGALFLATAVLFAGKGSVKSVVSSPWWELTGGCFGAFFVTMTIFAIPRIGTTAALTTAIFAQLTTSVILDHFGLFGFRTFPMDSKRGIGVALLMAGAGLILKK